MAGVVVVLDEPVVPSLARLAVRQGWPVLKMATARQAVPVVLRHQADLHVVQVSVCVDESLDLIRSLRAAPRKVPILAVAAMHQPRVERAVRQAGASCYVPGSESLEVLQRVVASLAPLETADGRLLRRAGTG
jgi:DNA-binding NarL/FixJ family response regulator